MKQSQHLLDNAVTCSQLAKRSTDKQTKTRFKRMEEAWRSLAREQDWLDGEITPIEGCRLGRPTAVRHPLSGR
jgi:flagellar capping protein FliD